MTHAAYALWLLDAAFDTRSPYIHRANAMERFFRRHRWLFSGEEAGWVLAAVSVSGWPSVAEQVIAERRQMRGEPNDPRRFGRQSSAVGLGIRALIHPHYFLKKAFKR